MRPFRLRAGARSGLLPISREDSLTDFLKECDLGVKQTGRALFMKGIRSRFTRDGSKKTFTDARACGRWRRGVAPQPLVPIS